MTATIDMPDSIDPANLPGGYPAYLGYADGKWPTAAALKTLHPQARVLALTVTGATLEADGCDIEQGDLAPDSGAAWASRKLSAAPLSRPVLYASVSAMPAVLGELAALRVARDRVRLLSAHYAFQVPRGTIHVCGPDTCAWPGVPAMNGTQWTSEYPGTGGSLIDMSVLRGDFFGAAPVAPPVEWTEFDVMKLPVLRQGDSDQPGEFFSVHRLQALLNMADGLLGLPTGLLSCDGQFGPKTAAAVVAIERHYGLTVDSGIAGQQVWSVLLTGAAA